MRIQRFIILNILGSIFELAFIMYVLHFFDPLYMWIYLIVFSLLVGIQIIKTIRLSMFEEVEPKTNQFKQYEELIKKAEAKRNKPLSTKYVHIKEIPSPAFYIRNTVYINVAFRQDKLLFEGILAHELGHATTRLGDVASFSVFRLSSTLSNAIMMIRLQTKDYKGLFYKIIDWYLYLLFMIISLLDELILNPFMREDEYLANLYALEITDGRALRTYYQKGVTQYQKQKMRYDLKHPTVLDMVEHLEKHMDLTNHEKDVYAVGTKIYHIKNAATNADRQIKTHNYYLHVLEHTEEVSLKLARNFELGVGTNKDFDQALNFYQKAFILGNRRVSINIAMLLISKERFSDALKYLEVATEENIRVSYYELGNIYEHGLVGEIDMEKALSYYKKGADLKERRCIKKVDTITKKTLLDFIMN